MADKVFKLRHEIGAIATIRCEDTVADKLWRDVDDAMSKGKGMVIADEDGVRILGLGPRLLANCYFEVTNASAEPSPENAK